MKERGKKYLVDITRAIERIDIHVQGIQSFENYSADITVKRAVERELEIVGEAMKKLLSIEPYIAISDTRKIIAMRNRIIHGYDTVDDTVVWNVLITSIPVLKEEVAALLNDGLK